MHLMKFGLLIFLALLTVNVCGQRVSKVGIRWMNFADAERKNWAGNAPRPVSTTVWYPAETKSEEEKVTIGSPDNPIFISGAAVKNADISGARKRYPLVVVSHGTGGSALQMMWLGQYLAARGFIVAAINHHGNTGAEDKYLPQGFILWWERARDLSFAIDRLLDDPDFGRRLDAKKIGVAGFSLGGATVTAAAGGVFDLDAYEKFCASAERDATCEPQPEYPAAMKEFEKLRATDSVVAESLKRASNSYLDQRVKAAFAIAPALGAAFTKNSLSAIKIPFRIIVGEADTTTAAKTNAEKLARAIKNSNLTILPGKVAHYTFLADCTDFGKTILPICRDDQSIDRRAVHQKVAEMAFEFFKENL